jgi:hypothetical protein
MSSTALSTAYLTDTRIPTAQSTTVRVKRNTTKAQRLVRYYRILRENHPSAAPLIREYIGDDDELGDTVEESKKER